MRARLVAGWWYDRADDSWIDVNGDSGRRTSTLATAMRSKSAVDRLGDRLRDGTLTETDLRALDTYRRSFAPAYSVVTLRLKNVAGIVPTGRPAKSTTAIIDKLRRESIRLSQIQDIAGCRIVVRDIIGQDALVSQLRGVFVDVVAIDRRERPSHGYRAVHLVVTESEHPVEIQVRTELQHLWAEFSEKVADLIDPRIKYGGGDDEPRATLANASRVIAEMELLDREIQGIERRQSILEGSAGAVEEHALRRERLHLLKERARLSLLDAIADLRDTRRT